jgi:PilZ domain
MKPFTSPAPTEPGEVDDRRKFSDRRAAPRRKILRGARAVWQNGDTTECIVHNLSETGAHLDIRGPAPNTFDLLIDCDQSRRSCRVIWRKANRIGVKFQELPQFVRAPIDSRKMISAYREHADECRTLAKRAEPSDRETLLRMAGTWETLARRPQKKT